MTRLVVVGGNGAGLSAASKAKRKREDIEVVVLEQGEHASYSTCGIPHLIDGSVGDPDELLVLKDDQMKERGIEVRLQTKALAFNPYTKSVAVEGPGGRDEVSYDKLLISTGVRARNDLKGHGLDGVHTVRHHDHGLHLLAHAQQKKVKRCVVVGGGYVGVEMAEALHRHGSEVHLFDRGERLLSDFDAELTEGFPDWLTERGIKVHLGQKVSELTGTAGKLTSVEADKSYKADLAVVAMGVEPATEMAVKAGIHTTKEGYILVDDNMQTNYHDVWAAGDCVAPRHILTGRPTPWPLALPANRMGRVAGDAIASSIEKIPVPGSSFPGILGTLTTRAFGLTFARTGLTEQEAKAEQLDYETALIESTSKANYMPGVAGIAVKMVADADSHKVLGCQMVGPEEAGLRINSAAVAIQSGMKAGKLADIEMAYAPPFGPVWDPILVAAGELAKKLRK